MEFLEDVLAKLDDNKDVLIMLNSGTIYNFETEPTTMQDTLGNHHASIWKQLIDDLEYTETFEVIKTEEVPTLGLKVTIDYRRCRFTEDFAVQANEYAVRKFYDSLEIVEA